MANSDVQRFLEEVVGYGKLRRLVRGPLGRIVELQVLPEKKRSLILRQLDGTVFGTMEADVDSNGDASCEVPIEIPRVLSLEQIAHGDMGSADTTIPDTEKDFDLLEEAATGTKTGDSSLSERYISDQKTRVRKDGRRLVGTVDGANYGLGSFDHVFTSNYFCVSRRVDPGRASRVKDYLEELMDKAGFPAGSYVIKQSDQDNPRFGSGKEEVVALNGKGYSMVFRPESMTTRGFDPDVGSIISGTSIYLDTTPGIVDELNQVANRYHEITGVRRGKR